MSARTNLVYLYLCTQITNQPTFFQLFFFPLLHLIFLAGEN